jgi:hypothetical protein
MVALAREPLTARDVRKLVYMRLPLWGSIQRHGPLAPGRSETSGGAFGSRLPVPWWYLDLSRAFAALNPRTAGVGHDGNFAGFLHLPFNDLQLSVWLYYVDELGSELAIDTARADRQHWQHDREREIAKAAKQRDWRGDDLVAARLHCSGRTAHRYRTEAVWAMAQFVRWGDEFDNGSALG